MRVPHSKIAFFAILEWAVPSADVARDGDFHGSCLPIPPPVCPYISQCCSRGVNSGSVDAELSFRYFPSSIP